MAVWAVSECSLLHTCLPAGLVARPKDLSIQVLLEPTRSLMMLGSWEPIQAGVGTSSFHRFSSFGLGI